MPAIINNNHEIELIKSICIHLLNINAPWFIEGDFIDNNRNINCYVVLRINDGRFLLYYYDNIEADEWYKCVEIYTLNVFEIKCLYSLADSYFNYL